MKYPVGTVVIARVGDVANDADHRPVAIPPDTAGVVVDMLQAPDGNEVLVLFHAQDATTLLVEEALDDTTRYLTIEPARTAKMLERLVVANHNLHRVLVALEAKDVVLAETYLRDEKQSMMDFLRQFDP